MAFKINGVVRIDNSGNGFLGIVTATDANITGVLTATEVDAKVSAKAISEQTDGTVDDVTGADELLLLDAETGGLLRVSVDEFVQGAGIGTIVTGFDNLTVTGVTTIATLKGIGNNAVSVGASLLPNTNLQYDLGSSTNRFRDLYISGNTIDMGGHKLSSSENSLLFNEKQVITDDQNGNVNFTGVTTITTLKGVGTNPISFGSSLSDVVVSGMLTADRFRSGDIAARNVITLGITTIQDHLEVNDSTGSGSEYNLNVKTNGSSTFGVLGNGAILLGNSSGAPFMATNDHHATSKKYVDDAFTSGQNITAGIVTASQFDQTVGPTWTSGTGSPEEAVTAPIGSYYSRTDGSLGATLYIKQTGIGSTGWDPVVGGTGLSAWGSVQSDGTIDASFNINSVSFSSNNYIVTFTTAMPTANYAVTGSVNEDSGSFCFIKDKTTTGFKVGVQNYEGANVQKDFGFTVHASSTVTPTYTWTRDGTTLKPANTGDGVEVAGQLTASFDQPSGFVASIVNTSTTGGDGLYLNVKDTSSAIVVQRQSDTQNSVLISGDGSAMFEETVDIGNATTSLSNTGVVLYSGGGIGIRNDTVTSAFQIYKDGNADSDRTVILSTDGSASFANNNVRLFHENSGSACEFWTGTTPNGTNVFDPNASGGAGAMVVRCFGTNGTGGGGVELVRSATSWGSYSQRSLKTALQPITDGLTKVGSLSAVTGKYKTDEDGVSRSFLIADEVKEVLPEAVSGEGTLEDPLSLRYTEVIPLLVSALHDAKDRIEALEAKVQSLEGGN